MVVLCEHGRETLLIMVLTAVAEESLSDASIMLAAVVCGASLPRRSSYDSLATEARSV